MAGITITADSATEFTGNAAEYNSSCRLDDNTFVIAYRDENDFNWGKAIVGTRSGTAVTISEANAVTFASADTEAITVRALSATKIVITFINQATNQAPQAIVGTVSGTSITFGSPVSYGSASYSSSVAVLDSSNFVISVADANVDDVLNWVNSVSGNTITPGSVQTHLEANAMDGDQIACVGLDSTHYVFAYIGNGGAFRAVVGLVNTGAQTITLGAQQTLEDIDATNDYEIFIDKFDSTHFIAGGVDTNGVSDTELKLVACSYDTSTLAITDGVTLVTGATAEKSHYSLCTMGESNFLVSWYTTAGTQAEVRSGTLTGSTDIAWDAQGAQVFDNSTSAYTTLCRLTDNYFLLGYKKG